MTTYPSRADVVDGRKKEQPPAMTVKPRITITVEIERIPEEWEDLIDNHDAVAQRILEDYLNNPRKGFVRMFRNARITGLVSE